MLKAFIKETSFGIFLTLMAMAIALVYIATPIFGNRALIVRSGSMEPAIHVGDLVVVQAQNGYVSPQPQKPIYKVGDVIAFKGTKNSSVVITHRITQVEVKEEKVFYQTKGDANKGQDQFLAPQENIIGKGTMRLPYVGKLIAFTKSNVGFPLLVVVPSSLVIIFELITISREIRKQKTQSTPKSIITMLEIEELSRRARKSMLNLTNLSSLKVLLPFLISTVLIYSTFAFFSDTETSTGNLFQAAETFGPPIAQTLVINEVLPDSSCSQGNTEAQWIEVYNGFSVTVNLKDFKITDGTNTIDLVTANNINVPPGGFALLAHNSAIWNNCYDDNNAITANLGGQLNIDVGLLQLLDSSSNIIDTVQWDGETGLNPAQNQSIERVPTGIDSATGANFNASDFIVREIPTPGYGTDLLLNEFVPDPQSTFTDEWVEIYNPSGASINLTGWTLKDIALSARSLTSLGSISAGGRVVYEDSGDGWLNNGSAETLQLKDPSGRIIDAHSYTGSSPDTSIGRENDGANTWKNCTTPTKNATNNGGC